MNTDDLYGAIRSSKICSTDEELNAATVDELVDLCNAELRAIADHLAPERRQISGLMGSATLRSIQ